MPIDRTRRIALTCAALLALGAQGVRAQSYPDHPVRLVNPFAAGAGAMDVAARVMAEKMGARLGQPVIVVNQPGAGGTVAAASVARGPKDGYSIYFGTSSTLGYARMLNKDVPYDPLQDFTPVALLGTVPVGFFVAANSPIRSVQDLIATARDKPDSINFGTPGIGTVTHIAVEMLMERTGVRMKHVPYGGNLNYWNDLIGGQLQLVSGGVTGGLPLVRDGRMRLIATATSARTQTLPDVPAVGDVLPGYDAPAWIGIAVARGTPEPVVARIESAAMEAFNDPDVRTTLGKAGIEVAPAGRQAFTARIRKDAAEWETTLGKAGLLAK